VTTYITLDGNGPDRPTSSVDGVRQPSDFAPRWVDRADMPFAGVYIADERQYDTEVWVKRHLSASRPARRRADETHLRRDRGER
jgi:hypothetical protein